MQRTISSIDQECYASPSATRHTFLSRGDTLFTDSYRSCNTHYYFLIWYWHDPGTRFVVIKPAGYTRMFLRRLQTFRLPLFYPDLLRLPDYRYFTIGTNPFIGTTRSVSSYRNVSDHSCNQLPVAVSFAPLAYILMTAHIKPRRLRLFTAFAPVVATLIRTKFRSRRYSLFHCDGYLLDVSHLHRIN